MLEFVTHYAYSKSQGVSIRVTFKAGAVNVLITLNHSADVLFFKAELPKSMASFPLILRPTSLANSLPGLLPDAEVLQPSQAVYSDGRRAWPNMTARALYPHQSQAMK